MEGKLLGLLQEIETSSSQPAVENRLIELLSTLVASYVVPATGKGKALQLSPCRMAFGRFGCSARGRRGKRSTQRDLCLFACASLGRAD